MDKKYSDSLFPLSIGTSFLLTFVVIMIVLSIAGFLVQSYLEDKSNLTDLGGIPLIILFLLFLARPLIYNRKKSRFEKDNVLLEKFDGLGNIGGFRGAFFRILLYEEGIEFRAFYQRHFIPYDKIIKVSIEKDFLGQRLNIKTGIEGLPNYVKSSGREFLSVAALIKEKVKSHKGIQSDVATPHC